MQRIEAAMPEVGYTKRKAEWTRQEMIDAGQKWYELHGDSPTATDWNPSDCRRAAGRSMARAAAWLGRLARFQAGEYPWTGSVWKEFGGWNAFLEAAELPIHHRVSLPRPAPVISADALAILTAKAVQLPDGLEKKEALLLLGETAFAWAERISDE